ncbi:MAG: DMT family transporter [Candidatus Latescibacter sp.]|nr:DMT family transporter [Candidatus Latescibacter sp.]
MYVTLVVFMWGFGGTVEVVTLRSLSPLQFGAWSCVCGALGVLAYLIFHGRAGELFSYRLQDHARLVIISLLGFGGYFFMKYTAYSTSPVPEASVLQSTYMVFIALFTIPILGQSAGLTKLFGIILGFSGAALIVSGGAFTAFMPSYISGYLCALGAGASFGLFCVLSEKTAFDRVTSLFYFHGYSAAALLLILSVRGELSLPSGAVEIAGTLYNGIATNVLGIFLWLTAQGSTDDVSLLTGVLYLVPFMTLLCFQLFLGIPIPFYAFQGLLLIVGGMAIHMARTRRSHKPAAPVSVKG